MLDACRRYCQVVSEENLNADMGSQCVADVGCGGYVKEKQQ